MLLTRLVKHANAIVIAAMKNTLSTTVIVSAVAIVSVILGVLVAVARGPGFYQSTPLLFSLALALVTTAIICRFWRGFIHVPVLSYSFVLVVAAVFHFYITIGQNIQPYDQGWEFLGGRFILPWFLSYFISVWSGTRIAATLLSSATITKR